MGETTAETLVQLRQEIEMASSRRSTDIFLATGKDGIELPAVSRRHILHVCHILQTAFYLQRSGSGIQQLFQHLALVEVFQRKQMFVTHNRLAIGIYQTERQATKLRTLSPVGAPFETSLADIALTAIADTKSPVHKNLERHVGTSLMNVMYFLQ